MGSRLTGKLSELERELAKYPGISVSDAQNRRALLRRAMTAWGEDRYAEGLLDGAADEREPRRMAEQAAADAGSSTGGF